MIAVEPERFLQLAPRALTIARRAFDDADRVLAPYGIRDNGRRLSHFLAQILHETAALTRIIEVMNYTELRLMEVWPARFPTPARAKPFARQPRALANQVYGGRFGNRDPDDGWRYIGRGPLMLTFRSNYRAVGERIGVDLEREPDLVLHPEYALPSAAAYWELRGCNAAADTDSVRAVTKKINGGYIGLLDREGWTERVQTHYGWRIPGTREA